MLQASCAAFYQLGRSWFINKVIDTLLLHPARRDTDEHMSATAALLTPQIPFAG